MVATAQTALFALPDLPPSVPAGPPGKRRTVLAYGLGADSTAIILKSLADLAAYGLEPELSAWSSYTP
ncbi:hypothetical protein OG217_05070 [Streptomyces sp. NBC_01023]|uniref:hypothetical protein n=1 Tax=Streptomyces sp. NBC_01023 TaxID=2903724 RepID=UPI003866FEE8|nr:hypothetical protein OG217_05070 [Streptomyces sp. NBC_01023]